MFDDDDNPSASIYASTPSGEKYDIKNISGKRKKELIAAGEIPIDAFIAPPNVPGKVLAEMRKRHRESFGNEEVPGDAPNEVATDFTKGMLVKHGSEVVEVLEVRTSKKKGTQALLPKREGGKVWVSVTKLEPHVVTEDEETSEG